MVFDFFSLPPVVTHFELLKTVGNSASFSFSLSPVDTDSGRHPGLLFLLEKHSRFDAVRNCVILVLFFCAMHEFL